MNITIFGATSNIGLDLINQSLAKNYKVTAFGRNIESFIDKDLHVDTFTAIKGYVFDADDINKALIKCDVVFSLLGGGIDGLDKTRSLGTKNIIQQMKKNNINRIIALGNECVLNTTDDMLVMNEENYPEELKPIAEEHLTVLHELQNSNLDWTLVCPNKIITAPANFQYSTNISFLPLKNSTIIGTGNMTDFILGCITNKEFFKQKIGICNN